jgi:hypothetical protein
MKQDDFFESLLTSFEASNIVKGSWGKAKTALSLKPYHHK